MKQVGDQYMNEELVAVVGFMTRGNQAIQQAIAQMPGNQVADSVARGAAMTTPRFWRTFALLLAVLLTPAMLPATGQAQTDQRCFVETRFCIAGRIRQFWEQNGGLRVFGLPLAPQQQEQIEGQLLQVQWFERNRLELHPEQEPPYDVLLGRIGADILAQQSRDPSAFPRSEPQLGCRFFPQTQHNICGEILSAWRASGLEFDGRRGSSEAESLALFGLPLSEPITETIEGQAYLVQWFERARFELHPENRPPFNVLLGLLGSELRGVPALQPLPQPSPGIPPPIDLPPDEASARLRVLEGFMVRQFAAGLDTPRLMTTGPDGALYVAERGAGRVVRLSDRDGDGRSDAIEPVVSSLTAPHNLEWIAGCLYVAENDEVSRHCDADGDGSLERSTRIVDLPSGGGHTTRTLHAGPDEKLYVSVGSSCNVCIEGDMRRAAILRFELDGSIPPDNPFASDPEVRRRAVWAEGLRNSIDFVFMPDGQLWANHNGRDNMIDARAKNERPLEELVIAVQRGKHHGWPFCTTVRPDGGLATGAGPYVEAPDPTGDVPPAPASFNCADAVPALFTGLAHSAPIGIARYDGGMFPADYAGDVFVALHGSWNRTPPAPCKVVRIVVENGQPVAAEDFLAGFQDRSAQTCGTAWGRPAGVTTGADGALYVSDDVNGRVYRISRSDEQ
jgi:glucose/arabinose dehydrogenase